MTTAAPPIRRFPPLYKCLGYVENPQGYRRFVVACGDPEQILIRRASELTGLGFLLTIYASAYYWRRLFPRAAGRRAGVDTHEAAAWFVRECEKVGPYQPPEHLRPRAAGRPSNGQPHQNAAA